MKRRSLFAYRGTSSSRADVVLAVCAFIGFVGLWHALSQLEVVPQRYLPLPWNVLAALYTMLAEQNFIEDIWISIARVCGARSCFPR